jgi:dynein heavy chain
MELDKDNIPETVVRKLKEYVEHPNFLPEIMETQSRACRSFCMWVRAVDGYTKTFRAVLPKKKR